MTARLLFAACFVLSLSGCAAPPTAWNTYVAAGEEAYRQKNYPDAERSWRAALEEAEARRSDNLAAKTLDRLAELFYEQGRYAEAEPLLRRALKILESAFGPERSQVAVGANHLGHVQQARGQLAEAEALYARSLAINEKEFGPVHPRIAYDLASLAGIHSARGERAQAEALYRRALAMLEKTLGPNHADVALILARLAQLLRDSGRETEAAKLDARATTIRTKQPK